ncbi:hypothetical protein GCM10022261_22680 [Brevibacterium daeguense]|uniref:Aminoglycoside phosphotransferase (APT) family kinase protein n=1 Tax=Brevibacterium daeguense TaxID=909936 RepID=A0ABP8ELT0_9MICO|nr:phosphotransferase [Brevibacterium daeguense]
MKDMESAGHGGQGDLQRRLTQIVGVPIRELDVRPLAGGASRQLLKLTAQTPDGPRPAVLRADHEGDTQPKANFTEAAVLAAAGAAGVPCPRLLHDDTPGELIGTPGMLIEFVEGETIARRILRDERFAAARRALPADLARAAAAIHAIDPNSLSEAGLRELVDPVASLAEEYREIGIQRPVFDLALARLEDTRPENTTGTAVVHGDFRLGNLMVDESGLAAVLDWELAHLGDPDEDLGYLTMRAWRFGGPGEVAGLGDLDAFLDDYARASGRRPDTTAVRWWQARATLWWGIGTLRQMQRAHENHPNELELLAIGRRAAEQEHDLLQLLFPDSLPDPAEAGAAGAPRSAAGAPRSDRAAAANVDPLDPDDLFSAPCAAELLGALSRWIDRDVVSSDDAPSSFRGRVARNVVDLVGRQRELEPVATASSASALATLGFASEPELAAAIRSGAARDVDLLVPALDLITRFRLSASNPRYLG